MKKQSTSITAGIALLAGLSAQAQEPTPIIVSENIEVAADLVEELVIQGQVTVSPKGDLKIDKSLFDVLRERGILKDNFFTPRGSDCEGAGSGGGGHKCHSM